jgi:hypothetical protein
MSAARIFAALWLPLVAQTSMALDWSAPWVEPHDSGQAASNSDEYAWRLFVAVNWPANAQTRTADPHAPLGADKPVVWEVWQNAEQVYREDGSDPGPWIRGHREKDSTSDESRFETFSLKDFPNARHIVAGKMVPLVDATSRARRLTEIRMNRPTFEYIRAHELYNLDGQVRMITTGRGVRFPPDSIEIKAKWRPVGPEERARYHTVKVRFADGTESLYGLTALHIVSKDLPQWFWATFEHVDNPSLPDSEGWQLSSSDHFACADAGTDCNRSPRGIGLEGTVWQNYRLRGTLTRFVDGMGRPLLLANSELERGFQGSSSCMTCHARSSLANLGGVPTRLPVFDMSETRETDSLLVQPGTSTDVIRMDDFMSRRGFVGLPLPRWFENSPIGGQRTFQQLDFVWSLSKARPRKVPHET